MSPPVLTHQFKQLEAHEASQIVPATMDQLIVRILPRHEYLAAAKANRVTESNAPLGQDVQVDVEFGESLLRTASGMLKSIVSSVGTGL